MSNIYISRACLCLIAFLNMRQTFQRMLLSSFFSLIVLSTNLVFWVESICDYAANYTRNSGYRNNLNSVLSIVLENIDINGFYNASAGRDSLDRANAIGLCRADVQPHTCRVCIHNITNNLLLWCPNQRRAHEWDELCMLGYSDKTIFGIVSIQPARWEWNRTNAARPDQLMGDVTVLLEDLRGRAAKGGSLRKVAAGNVTADDFQFIYGLVECTPDLSPEDCCGCLFLAVQYIYQYCYGKIGCRVTVPSCNIRYEGYPFYNETRLQELGLLSVANGTYSGSNTTTGNNATTRSGNNTTTRSENNTTTGNVTIVIIVVLIAAGIILAASVFICLRKRIKRKPHENHEIVDDIITTESLRYTLSTIRDATNDFSDDNKLGQGGFGAVYKGELSNGQEIAVKRLSRNSGQGDLEFKNEVLLLAKLQHRNLVRLLGFCLEGTEKLLIYEFVQNASLDRFIFDPAKRAYLDWETRYKIIGGITKGILYLHEDSQLRIIHRDLKPSNVLLDGAMNPKIADFGMARLFGQDETQANTSKIAGTFGYMAPEYAARGQFSVKSDVFSFGVLVLKDISGQKNNCARRGENVEGLLSRAWKNWREITLANMVDPCLRSVSGSIDDMLRCIHIALLCVQENAVDRPTMASLVLMLNNSSLTLTKPSETAFYMSSYYDSETSLLKEHNSIEPEYINSSTSKVEMQSDSSSTNEASVTVLHPR